MKKIPFGWIYLIIGLLLVITQPSNWLGWLGWFFLNIDLGILISMLMIVAHELGHAVTVCCLGIRLNRIVIGSGKTLFTLRLLGILWEVKRFFTAGGITLFSVSSTHFYRLKIFLIILSGPLTNFLLIFLELEFFTEITSEPLPGTYLFPGIMFYSVNTLIMIVSLLPHKIEIDGVKHPSDGLQLLTVPFLSKQEIFRKVALSYVLDGIDWNHRGNYEKATISFSKAIQEDPTCIQAYQGRGNAYQATRDYQKAIDDLNQAIKLEPRNATSYYLRGIAYKNWRKIDPAKLQNAIEDLSQAIHIEPNNEAFYFTRAAICTYEGKEIQAIEDFTKLIQLSPNQNSYYNRGVTYYQHKNYQAAIEDFNQAIKINSKNLAAYYVRGNAKYELQDEAGALQDYDKAELLSLTETIDSRDEHGFYARGIAHVRLGNKNRAMKDFQTAETFCLENGNTKLIQQIKEETKKF